MSLLKTLMSSSSSKRKWAETPALSIKMSIRLKCSMVVSISFLYLFLWYYTLTCSLLPVWHLSALGSLLSRNTLYCIRQLSIEWRLSFLQAYSFELFDVPGADNYLAAPLSVLESQFSAHAWWRSCDHDNRISYRWEEIIFNISILG